MCLNWVLESRGALCSVRQPLEVRLIDFQISTWGSPVCDLLYFFSTVSGEVREQRDVVVAEYHAELAESLRALGASHVPELHELQVGNYGKRCDGISTRDLQLHVIYFSGDVETISLSMSKSRLKLAFKRE